MKLLYCFSVFNFLLSFFPSSVMGLFSYKFDITTTLSVWPKKKFKKNPLKLYYRGLEFVNLIKFETFLTVVVWGCTYTNVPCGRRNINNIIIGVVTLFLVSPALVFFSGFCLMCVHTHILCCSVSLWLTLLNSLAVKTVKQQQRFLTDCSVEKYFASKQHKIWSRSIRSCMLC